MSFRFTTQKLTTGLYEPEGIYLQTPFTGEAIIGQSWGAHADDYSDFQYNGIPLKGHNGVDFLVETHAHILAVDNGRVAEVGFERGGYERYLKLEHRWGESFYAFLDEINVDSGQIITRSTVIATAAGDGSLVRNANEKNTDSPLYFFHFAIRVAPFNRLDGFGGFIDPLPFLNPAAIQFADDSPELLKTPALLHKMLIEKLSTRRP